MSKLWSLVVRYWKELGISVPTAIGALVWIHGKYKAQRQKRLDSKVLEALGNHVWSRNRPVSGGGETFVRASEIAELLGLGRDVVAESLERLQTQGKVKMSDGTLADPTPYWFIIRR